MKFNNKTLIALVAVLVVAVLYLQFGGKKEGTFNKNLFALDTAKVNLLTVYPNATPGEQLIFLREGTDWLLNTDSVSGQKADPGVVKGMLNTLAGLQVKRLAATGKDKWAAYEVDENTRRVVAKNGNKVLLDVYIGKFNIAKPENSVVDDENFNPYQMQRPSVNSYIRLAGDDKVYAVEGMLSTAFSRKPDELLMHQPAATTPADSIPTQMPQQTIK
ncbi:DUF4340 domain-containing protein [Sphingobacteriales bacterium UPWRP_1]|nr:hypothetical protein BVG80_16890 [Sphingobacteriales bacterium TSM_CSM]PSJ74324.1 DUF4340 domain-containing protein [Sphingobacteriales bacterium UPWRP_1]